MRFSDISLSQWLELLASRSATPAGGALAYVTLASHAALFAKICRLCGGDSDRFFVYAKKFLSLAEEDTNAYLEILKAKSACDLSELLNKEIERAKIALEFIEAAAVTSIPKEYMLIPDHEATLNLSIGAAATVLDNADVNIRAATGKGVDSLGLLTQVNHLKSRLAEYKERVEYR
jgi:formiminotetrahydrofolate cyclodeaminase